MTKFDELNRLRDFFDGMDLTNTEREKRVELAKGLFDAFYFILALMRIDKNIDRQYYVDSLKNRVYEVLKDIEYEPNYIDSMCEEVIDTTIRHEGEDYFYSDDRAVLIAQNEANSVFNTLDYIEAKARGLTQKQWLAELDDRTRFDHIMVDKTIIPIDEYFDVGLDRMRFPHDSVNASPENVINCRCTCLYF